MEIEFIEGIDNLSLFVDPPVPAKLCVPQYYKDVDAIDINKMSIDDISAGKSSVKMCHPFLDGLLSGYIQKTWCDIHIELSNNQVRYLYPHEMPIIKNRDRTAFGDAIILQSGFYSIEFIWQRYWIPKLPKNYSLLITHPISRFDLPFYTMSAIIDADEFYHHPVGNIPFYIKNGFSGVIPAGTPMYQMIPVKRDNWKMKVSEFSNEVIKRNSMMKKSFFQNYKKLFRQKKYYE